MIDLRATPIRLAIRLTSAMLIVAFLVSAVAMIGQAHAGESSIAPSIDLQRELHSTDGGIDKHVNTCCPVPCQWEAFKSRQAASLIWFVDMPWRGAVAHMSGLSKIPPKRPPRAFA